MATRNIIKIGNPLLREHSREVTVFDEKLGILIDDMTETMFQANGVGLAAPQVPRRSPETWFPSCRL